MTEVPSDKEAKVLFEKLKPLCVRVITSPSLESLTGLRGGLSDMLGSGHLHPHLVDYVLLPVRMVINKFGSTNLRLLEGGLETLETVLAHVRGLDKWELFHSLLVLLCMLLDPKMAKQAGISERSEDLVLVCVRALRELLLSPSQSVRWTLLSQLPAVGHCVSVLLDTLRAYASKTLHHQTLSTLLALTGVNAHALTLTLSTDKGTPDRHGNDSDIDSNEGSINAHSETCMRYLDGLVNTLGVGPEGCGQVFAAFLPGISLSIAKLVTTETNLGSSVTLLCLLTWAHYVAMVMKDSECSCEMDADESWWGEGNGRSEGLSMSDGRRLEVKRTSAWQHETDSKLCQLVQRMCGLVTSEGWRVRVGVVGWAHVLLTHSYRTLTTSTPHLLESLVTLSHDDYLFLSNSAHHVITSFSHRYDNNQSATKLTSLLEGRVHSLCSALPRLMRQTDDKRKIATLQLLSGYLRLLGSHVISLTHSHPHLSRLTLALIQTLEVQVPDTRIVEHPLLPAALNSKSTPSQPTAHTLTTEPIATEDESRSSDPAHLGPATDSRHHTATLALRFTHFRDERIETLLYSVCQLLGRHGDLQVVVDHLMDVYRSSSSQRREVLLILTHVLSGAKEVSSPSPLRGCGHLVREVVLELVEISGQEQTTPTKHIWANERPSNHQGHVLHTCLLLNTILVCSSILKTTFDPLLQQLAYPLMQWVGDGDPSVSTYAGGVVNSIAMHAGYRSVAELITANADYLVNSTALHLRNPSHLSLHLGAAHVLQAVLTHGNEEVLPLIRDSLDELLFSLDARRQSPAHIWPTLNILANSCLRWSSCRTPLNDPPPNATNIEEILKSSLNKNTTPRPQTSPDDIKQFFLDYHAQKEAEDQGTKEREDEGDRPEEEDLYSQKRELPPVTRAAVSVMQRCAHHLSSPTQQVQLLVLEALTASILTLRHNQESLLPEVHDVWASFLPRLSDPSPPVALRAWRVMLVMCEACGGFLRKRIVAKVWPPLVRSLQSLATKSLNTDRLYKQTAQCKLQQCLLACVSTLCVRLEVPTTDLETVVHSTLPYLSRNQPPGLQEACVSCLRELISYDPDVVWLLLQQLCPHTVCTPPDSLLKPYSFREHSDSELYADNVHTLLMFCSEC